MANGALLLGQIVSGKPGFQLPGMIACALSIGAMFGVDLFTPLGAGVSFLYTIVVWAGVWRATPKQAIALGTVSSVLIIFGFFLSPGTVVWNAITNRVISLVSLWFVLYFGMSYRKAVDTLSERELTDFVENAPVGMHWVGRDGTLLWANQEALNMLGYRREEYLGHHIAEFYADRNVIEDVLDTLNANVTLKNHEARLRHKDGSLRHVLISSNAYFDDGRFVHTRCFTTDITDRVRVERATSESGALAALNAQLRAETIERRAAEEVLREREELLRVTFDSAPVGISIVDPDGRFVKTNITYQRMVGYSEEELRHETNLSITHPDDCPHIRTLRQELIAGKREFFEIEKRNRTKNGELIWVRSKVSLIKDGVGKPRVTVAVVQDITARKRSEEALRRSEERFSKIFRSSPIAIAIETVEEGRTIDVNDRHLEFFGYQREELIGRTGPELGLWVDPNQRAERMQQLKAHGSVRDFEARFRRKSGEIVIGLMSMEVMQLHGEPVQVAMHVDITERKQAEEKLRESEDRYRDLVEHSQDLICTHDLDGRILSVNPWAAKVLRYEQAELVNMNLRDVLASSVRHEFDEYLAAIRIDGAAHGLMLVQPRAGKKRIWEYNNTLRTEGVSTPIVRGMAHDITEQLRAERALQERTAQLRMGEVLARMGSLEWDIEADHLTWSRSPEWLLGPRPASGSYLLFKDMVHPEDRQQFLDRRQAALEGLEEHLLDFRIIRTDGEVRWIDSRGRVLRDTAGRAVRMQVVLQDITERKRAEEAQARLAAIVENATVAIFTRTLDGTILTWNPGAERMLGYTAAEAIGQSMYFTLPPGRPPNLARNNENLLRREVVARESDRITKDGRVIDVLTSHSPVRDGAGNIVGASVILQDISALKQAQAAVKQSEQRFRAIFDYAGVGITMRPAHSRNHPWVQVNDHFCKLLGYTREELLGLSTADITPADEQAPAVKDNERLLRGEISSYVREKRVVRKDGSEIWVILAVAALPDAGGRPVNLIAVYQDISERKRAERELQRQAALSRLLESLAAAANKADTPEEALAACLERICAYGGWNIGHVLQITRDGDAWRAAGIHWHFTDARAHERFSDFFTLSTRTIFGNAVGVFIDQVIPTRAPRWIPDLDQVRRGARLTWARETGVRSAFAFPVIVHDEVVACVEFFAAEVREPDTALIDAAGDIASHLARVIERDLSGKTQAHLAAIVETSPDAIVSRALDGTILSWNQGAERMFGYRAAEVFGKNALIVPEDRIAETQRNREFVNAGNTLSQFETARITRDGRRIEVAVSAAPIRDAAGNVVRIAMIFRDITERTRAEAERSYLLNVLEASVNETYLFDAQTLRFEYVNRSGLNNLGYSLEQMRDMTSVDLKREFTEASFREMLGPLLRGEKKMHMFHSAHRRADGSSYPVEVHLQLVEHGDRRVFLAIILDVTERKRAEEERTRYLNRLRALSRRLVETQETERRRLAAELHDRIGQNLTALTINLNIVSSQLSPESAAQHAARLEDSRVLVEATIETVRDVMAELRPTVLDDYGLLAALRWYGRQFEKRSGVLTTVEAPDLIPRLPTEAEAGLYRIAQEALNNTLKHANARCATLRLDADTAHVTLTVADDGEGFDSAFTEQHARHPGWGLLMMRERAESVGGRLRVDSVPAHGTQVMVEIDRPA